MKNQKNYSIKLVFFIAKLKHSKRTDENHSYVKQTFNFKILRKKTNKKIILLFLYHHNVNLVQFLSRQPSLEHQSLLKKIEMNVIQKKVYCNLPRNIRLRKINCASSELVQRNFTR